ncbi:hypothetical protein [uncultured Meiothermus sp.]|jgi:hypothetical protein|uniref:hypothetical protein n=1 Tax=uncultured Meiothermus sp. TaxID=157471 RepID=UPI002628CBDA|nr:hypothetical protein [uncultured Meiothermus sp.]
MKRILFKLIALVVGKFLARRFGYRGGYGTPYNDAGYDPYYRGYRPYQGGFFKPYKYKKKKSRFKKLKDIFD